MHVWQGKRKTYRAILFDISQRKVVGWALGPSRARPCNSEAHGRQHRHQWPSELSSRHRYPFRAGENIPRSEGAPADLIRPGAVHERRTIRLRRPHSAQSCQDPWRNRRHKVQLGRRAANASAQTSANHSRWCTATCEFVPDRKHKKVKIIIGAVTAQLRQV